MSRAFMTSPYWRMDENMLQKHKRLCYDRFFEHFNAKWNNIMGIYFVCFAVTLQVSYADYVLCPSNQDINNYHCNATWEYCCATGCCESGKGTDDDRILNSWYFWVGLAAALVFLVAGIIACGVKCYRQHRQNLNWGVGDVSGAELYRTVQDARGLIRPFLATKQPTTNGVILTHCYGASGETDDGLSPLQAPYPPLRPLQAESLATRRNSDQIASIIMPPGFVPQEDHHAG